MNCLSNRNTEVALIGMAISYPSEAPKITSLPDELFAGRDTLAALHAIRRIVKRNETPDPVTVSQEAEQEADVYGLVAEAISSLSAPSFYSQYVAILEECLKRREIQALGQDMIRASNDPSESPDKLLAKAGQILTRTTSRSAGKSLEEAYLELYEQLSQKTRLVSTGIANLDDLIGGFKPKQLIVLGARPGQGKSAMATYIACNVADRVGPVLYVSREMSEVEIAGRVVARYGKINAEDIEQRRIRDFDKIAGVLGETSNIPLVIDTVSVSPMQIYSTASTLRNRPEGLAMVVVDYIQLLRGDGRFSNRAEEVADISRSLKTMASDLDVPVLALTQFNRESEKGGRRAPSMSEARESGAIEQDANIFITLYIPPEDGERMNESFNRYRQLGLEYQVIHVQKNRGGRNGVTDVGVDFAHMDYRCVTKGDYGF